MFVKERYGEPEVPRDEERGREGPGWREGGRSRPRFVVRILMGPVVCTERASAGKAQNTELSAVFGKPGLRKIPATLPSSTPLPINTRGGERESVKGTLTKFENRSTPDTIKRNHLRSRNDFFKIDYPANFPTV